MIKKGIKSLTVIVVIAVIAIILGFTSFYTVKEGSVAIVERFGKVIGVKEPGLHFKLPFADKKTTIVTREQTIKFGGDEEFAPIRVSTKDMQTIGVDLTVSNITTDPMKVYKSFVGRQLYSMLLPRIKDSVQTNVSKYTIEEFVSKRATLADDIFNDIKKKTEKYGIVITNVSITNHRFSEVYRNAVEEKKAAEQAVETEKALQKKKIVEQESKIKLAELKVKERELEAKANKVETESITPELLNKWFLEKWDGKMPAVTGSNGGFVLPSNIFQKEIEKKQIQEDEK